ncbi:S41 family peptidase [Vulgatibacter sp.]|uniref:S41 family peptidase n=1 Tax=Vulgatibacter sp. TaxID=1971226 RepID=UPI0035634812
MRRLPHLASLFCAFVAGIAFHASIDSARAAGYGKLDVFARVLAFVENNYVDEVDGDQLVYGAIKGMLASLDPHTIFLPPEEYQAMRADTSGEFGGLGVEVMADEASLLVVAPIDDTPASRAGIKAGDRILAIDGESTKGMSVAVAVRRMRGALGTRVILSVMREGFDAPLQLALLRDRVRVQSVEWRLYPDGRGYVKIKSFQERTDEHLGKALGAMREKNGGKELAGLVIDLRNNPGGLLDQAVRVADRFVGEGLIVSTEGRGGRQLEAERAHAAGTEPAYPLVVLVNGGSASASEIVAGALQDHDRAVVLGTTTFGKGSVQTVIDLDDGSGLKMTIARYYTPKHRTIHGKGVEPDLVVKDEEAGEAVAVNALAHGKGRIEPVATSRNAENLQVIDQQLDRALHALGSWERFRAELARKAKPASQVAVQKPAAVPAP